MSSPRAPITRSEYLLSLANGDRPISHTEVGRNGSLTTNTSSSGRLRSGQALEDTDLENTRDLPDLASQHINRPHTILATAVLASLDIGLDQQRLEGRIDNEEVLIGLQRTFLGSGRGADCGVDTSKFLELIDNAVGSDRSDLDRNGLPVTKKTRLEFAVVYGESKLAYRCDSENGGGEKKRVVVSTSAGP